MGLRLSDLSSVSTANDADLLYIAVSPFTSSSSKKINVADFRSSVLAGTVLSVNGLTGAVLLDTDDIDEGVNLYYTQARFDSALALKTTSDVAEGTNLYYTSSRFNTAFSGKSTSDLAEGTNLYYTQSRFDSALALKSTSDLTEGTNLYYTQSRFDAAFSAKDTDDLAEGTAKYFTEPRVLATVLTGFATATGAINATDTILQAFGKTDGNISLKANSASPTFTGTVTLDTLQASGSGGMTLKDNSGSTIALLGAGGGTNATFYGAVALGSASGSTGSLMFNGTTSGTVTLSVADIAGTWTMKLPDSAGTTGQVLTTDGSGNTSWATVSGGGSFSWGATASGTSGTGIGLTIDDSASASTTMQSFTWGNTQTNATLYGQQFNYGTSTIAKVGSYHNMTGGTTNAMLVNYGYSGSNISALKITATAGIPIGTTHGAIYFASALAYSNATSGVGINFSNLTLGTASSCNASAIKFDSIAYGSSTVAYMINANYLAYGSSSQGFGLQFTFLAYGTSAVGKLINIDTMANTGTTAYLINSTYGAAGTGANAYLISINTAVTSAGGSFLGYYISTGISGAGTSTMMYVNTGSNHASSTFYGFRVVTLGALGTAYGVHIGTVAGQSTATATAFHITNLNHASNTGGNNAKYLSFGNAQSASLVGQSTTTAEILHSRTHTGATSISDTFDLFHLRKTSVVNNAGGTYTVSGSVLKLENVSTQTAGTLADSVTVLRLVQSANSTGAPLSVLQNKITSTNFRKILNVEGINTNLWVGDGTTSPNGALTGNSGDFLINGDSGNAYKCTGGTTWVAV